MNSVPSDIRANELRRILNAVSEPCSKGRLIAVTADPGLGKTQLLAAVARERRWSERPAVVDSCSNLGPGRVLDRVRTYLREARSERTAARVSQLRPARYCRDLIVLDDAHLADEQTCAELCEVASGASAPLADVVIGLRPRQTPAALRRAIDLGVLRGATVEIELCELTDQQLIAVAGNASLDLRRRCGGSPFAVKALIALDEETSNGASAATAPFTAAVLHEIHDLLPNQRRVLYAAAVLRSGFDYPLLARVAELDLTMAESAAAGLLHRDLLRVAKHGRLMVRDETFGRLVHQTIDSVWLAAAHQRALSFTPDQASDNADYHLLNSPREVRERDMKRVLDAAIRMTYVDATQAISSFTSVIADVSDDDMLGLQARLSLARLLAQVGRPAEASDLLLMVADSGAVSPAVLGPHVAAVTISEGLLSRASGLFELLADMLRRLDSERDEVWLDLVVAAHFRRALSGDPADRTLLDEAARLAVASGNRGMQATIRAVQSLEHDRLGQTAEAEYAITTAESIVDRLPDQQLLHSLPGMLLLTLANVYAGRFRQGQRIAARAIEIASRGQHTYMLPTMFVLLSECERQLGRLEQAVAAADNSIVESGAGNGYRHAQALALKAQAEIWRQPAGSGVARGIGQRALAQTRLTLSNVNGCAATAALAVAKSAWLEGNSQFCIALLLSEAKGDDLPAVPLGQRGQVWELLCAAALDEGLPVAQWVWRMNDYVRLHPLLHNRAFAEICGGHALQQQRAHAAAAASYDRAAAAFERGGMGVEQAYALGMSARALAQLGDDQQVVARVQSAQELAIRSNAEALLQWVSDPIVGTKSPTSESTVLLSGLTPREREIALLVGGGLKRQEIADRLSISLRTVDVHLTRVYRKSGTGSIVQLALALSQHCIVDQRSG